MAGHGGLRPGAGRPVGGISQTRRLLLQGLNRGLAYAARAKGLKGSDEDLAVESVARIASDLILAGNGRDVLAIYAQAAPKSDDGDAGGSKSPLVQALERMPGMLAVPGQSQRVEETEAERLETPRETPGPTNPQSVAPFFAPQVPLLPPDLEPAPGAIARDVEPAPPPASRAPGPGGLPPTPGGGHPTHSLRLNAENFEKNPEDA